MSKVVIPTPNDPCIIRYVKIDEYKLLLWDCFRERNHKSIVGYCLFNKDGSPLFVGEDCYVPSNWTLDRDEVIRNLMGFLTLRLGDTDAEYFEKYSEEQMHFCETDAERLSLYVDDSMPLENITRNR